MMNTVSHQRDRERDLLLDAEREPRDDDRLRDDTEELLLLPRRPRGRGERDLEEDGESRRGRFFRLGSSGFSVVGDSTGGCFLSPDLPASARCFFCSLSLLLGLLLLERLLSAFRFSLPLFLSDSGLLLLDRLLSSFCFLSLLFFLSDSGLLLLERLLSSFRFLSLLLFLSGSGLLLLERLLSSFRFLLSPLFLSERFRRFLSDREEYEE
mmetsp:Transcript_19067/g.47365  ORF Transcript_19067/g.47365 Transcript_19067/m.47365 type:complete len:210 (-) Transcript_19067:552-1181(-)